MRCAVTTYGACWNVFWCNFLCHERRLRVFLVGSHIECNDNRKTTLCRGREEARTWLFWTLGFWLISEGRGCKPPPTLNGTFRLGDELILWGFCVVVQPGNSSCYAQRDTKKGREIATVEWSVAHHLLQLCAYRFVRRGCFREYTGGPVRGPLTARVFFLSWLGEQVQEVREV